MKLYELPRGATFKLNGKTYRLERIDGMYSRCFDNAENIYHFSAITEVEYEATHTTKAG